MAEVTIYTRQFCGYCVAAKSLLADKGAAFAEIDATYSPEYRQDMRSRSGRATFPQIFIGSQHIGGYDDLRALEAQGAFDGILSGAEA